MSDSLPTERQREALCELIALAFIELRSLGWSGAAKQAGDLADAFHNVSREMHGWGSWSWTTFKGVLQNYQDKYKSVDPPGFQHYVAKLEEIRANP